MDPESTSANHKRSRLEIYLDILRAVAIESEKKPTRIMYKTNLSWIPLKEILNSMIVQGLLIKNGYENKTEYAVTEKGLNVLRYFNKMREMIVV